MRVIAVAVALVLALAWPAAPGIASPPTEFGAGDLMQSILQSHPGLQRVVESASKYRFQAVLGQLEEGPEGRVVLVQHGFRSGAEYFYPASAVKLFAAVAALQRLQELRSETGLAVDADTSLVFHPLFAGERKEDSDPSNLAGGRITVRHEIRKLFLVSDNEAFNRLYELVGQDRLAASLARAGLGDACIVHRLSEARTPEENRRFPRIDLLGEDFSHSIPERIAEPLPPPPPVAGLRVGRAYLSSESQVDEPMDFSLKNRFSLADLQRGLCMVVRPDVECGGAGFALSDEDRTLLLGAMSQYPRDSTNPVYDPVEYPDDWVKFLLPGLERVVPRERLRIYNKAGQAYGFSVENAWVVDQVTGRSFFLAAALYTNEDGVLNDDEYEYESVALPFLADLGEAVARWLWGDSPAPSPR